MKKQYSKPGIIIEDFAIAQNIASNCGNAGGHKHTHAYQDVCTWMVEDVSVFTDSNFNCEIPIMPGERFEDICYNNPDGGISIFGFLNKRYKKYMVMPVAWPY